MWPPNTYSVTPRTPQVEKFFAPILALCALLFLLNVEVRGQDIVQLDSLENSLKNYHLQAWQADRKEFLFVRKGKAWAHLPAVGFQFGLPSITWNSREIYIIKKEKKEQQAKLASIDRKHELDYQEALRNLRIDYQKYLTEKAGLDASRQLLQTDSLIHSIQLEAYQKRETAPLEYLKQKKTYETAQAQVQAQAKELELLRLELYKVAHYYPGEEAVYLINN